ncbi:MAG TPA: hypothetical protein ENJ45_00335, partial [Phaeodactylibacter sp.]|nr:hypothetical protein [Phaeodactylibacter sp.]
QPYTKGSDFEFVPYFALTTLKEKVKQHPEDPLYKLLLHKMYLDAFEINNAERVLKPLLEKAPENYLYLLSMNLLYGKAENETLQNKYYDLLTKHYPKDRDILANDISKYQKEKNKTKVKELIDEYLKRYSTPYIELVYQILVDKLDENYEAAIRKINKLYAKYPYDYYAVAAKYEITSAVYNNPQAARVVLRDFLKKNFNYSIASELANNYVENGLPRKAINLYEEIAELLDYSMYPYTNISNIYARQSDYDEAIAVAKKIIANRPYDHETLASLGFFYMQKEDKKKALHYYEKALSYYPFDAETNDKIRELKGLSTSLELVENLKPEDIIAAYEKDFTPSLKKPYDIVLDEKTTILFKSKATAKVQHYILKLNTEQALKDWQRWNIGRTSGMKLTINEAKNIKTNGNTIDAERHGAEVVFTNLEVGDYIYLYYTEQQRSGGKSDLFVSDHFSLNSYYPIYRKRYTVLSEKGLDLVYETINTDMKPEQSEVEGFVKYQWKVLNPELLEDEPNSPSFSDIAQRIHISLGNSWYDIAEWYNDLSGHQARADYTIEQINKELFEGKNYSDEEKAKVIYDFVCKTIQYSSIDFRQSSYIPQKAADVYHSRLGDCKDISTLYAAIARKAGLNADLVLINTRNNGQKDVLLPSLNFN